jgi:phosphoribosyl-ATP pyrophosphohydrolase
MMAEPFEALMVVLRERQANPSPGSYTARLLAEGEDEIVKKIGEEAIEIILAARGQGDERLLEETADLIYHLSVLLVARDLTWSDLEQVLARRAGQ